MVDTRKFIMDTLHGMVGNEPDYKVRKYALGWLDKGELTLEDIAEINAKIEAQYIAEESTEEV